MEIKYIRAQYHYYNNYVIIVSSVNINLTFPLHSYMLFIPYFPVFTKSVSDAAYSSELL